MTESLRDSHCEILRLVRSSSIYSGFLALSVATIFNRAFLFQNLRANTYSVLRFYLSIIYFYRRVCLKDDAPGYNRETKWPFA